MLTKEKIIEILKKELPYLKNNFNLKKIGLFGSFAKDTAKENSDVDIIVEFEKPIGLKFFTFAEYIETLLNRKTDILTLEGIKSIRLKKVIEDIQRNIIYV